MDLDENIDFNFKWNIIPKEVLVVFEELSMFNDLKNLSQSNKKKETPKSKKKTTSKNEFVCGKRSTTQFQCDLYPGFANHLNTFVNTDPDVPNVCEDPQSPTMQTENQEEEYAEYIELEDESNKKNNKRIVRNGKTKSSIEDQIKNLEKMNLPTSLKERFGVSLAKLKRKGPEEPVQDK